MPYKSLFIITLILHGSIFFGFGQRVLIGQQVWSTKNLDVDTFRNGDPILEAKTCAQWESSGKNHQPAWCYYNNDPANGAKYGKLYNWYALTDPRGLAPKGWHLPSNAEWETLWNNLCSCDSCLCDEDSMAVKIMAKVGWVGYNNSTNSSRFSALPGGSRYTDPKCYFKGIGESGTWWSSTEDESGTINIFRIFPVRDESLPRQKAPARWRFDSGFRYKEDGFSIRCIKDILLDDM